MKRSNRLWTALLVAAAVVLSAGAADAAKVREEKLRVEKGKAQGCSIKGTWYGFNALGEAFLITITKTGSKTYSGIGQAPALPPDPTFYPGVVAGFYGTQGDLTKAGPNRYDTTWMNIWRLDPEQWMGFDMGAIVSYGEIQMPDCDTWQASFRFEAIGYNFGEDPFEAGVLLDSGGPFTALYKRLPKYPD